MSKKKWLVKSVCAAFAVFASVGLAGCVDNTKDLSGGGSGIGEASSFDFSTKKTVDINLAYSGLPAGYRAQYELYTKSPLTLDQYKSYIKDTTLLPFLSGICDESGKVSFKCELPASVNEIYAYSFGIGVPALMKATVSDAGVVSEFKVIDVPAAAISRAGETLNSGTSSWTTYNVELKKPELKSVFMSILKEDKETIDRAFPKDQEYGTSNTYYRPCIKLSKKATVKIYSVSHAGNSNRTNALAYYEYKQVEGVKPEEVNSNLQLAFPELTKTKPAEGDGYQLVNNNGDITFEAGSCIVFALFPNITVGQIPTTNAHLLYSTYETGSWNTYSYPKINGKDGLFRSSAPHMVTSLLRTNDQGHAIVAISFEDQPWSSTHGTNKGDFRDDIFILEIDPADAVDLPDPPKPEDPLYPNKFTQSGILCFEDCWPEKGDYDLNDVVVAYEQTSCLDKNYVLGEFQEKYTFLHNGATYANGFAYQLMGVKQSDIEKCTVTSEYKFTGQGLDQSDDAVIVLFDNTKNIKSETVFTVVTTFKKGVPILFTGVNPFAVTAGNYSGLVNILEKDRIEIHLPTPKGASTKYLPTSKANGGYWGTKDDKSVPDSKVYYVREGNYPFALNLNWDSSKHGSVTNFKIPTEKLGIEETYPKFTEWVKSGGMDNTDWYFYPKN